MNKLLLRDRIGELFEEAKESGEDFDQDTLVDAIVGQVVKLDMEELFDLEAEESDDDLDED